ncbi:MAG TPA: DUF177 domain-containing protein [Pyrinomonadaceae bacterium]|jgi:uncharacterized protein|nr:DUF177 domain-containing protein [Pyrinomonadaceae bacterium]
MIIELNDLDSEPKRFDVLVKPEEIDLGLDEVVIKGDVSVRCEVTRHIAQTDLAGTIAFAADIDCARCLKPVPKSFLFNFDVSFVSPEDFATSREKEVSGEELSTDVLPDGRIDVNNVVREQILLNLPEQVLCTEECKGLCPKCGADRNLINCNCEETETDPRWSALKNFK